MATTLIMRLLFLITLLQSAPNLERQPSLGESDRTRIAEAFHLAQTLQDDIWEGWTKAPFALLLITAQHEFLIRHPNPSSDFTEVGYDSLLQSTIHVRPRVFSQNLRACFPAVGGISTIVIGQPEGTGQSSTFWVLTVLHEHFHQLQNVQPDYYKAVKALDLARGDKTGNWMLNYAFPYDSTTVSDQLAALGECLLRTIRSIGTPYFARDFSRYLDARSHLRDILSEDDYRYLSFQLWQEGVAKYTEYRIARVADREYEPSEQFQSLGDFVPFDQVADSIYTAIETELAQLDLPGRRRLALYSLGAAEALLLDAVRPGWHRRYFKDKFFLEKYYE